MTRQAKDLYVKTFWTFINEKDLLIKNLEESDINAEELELIKNDFDKMVKDLDKLRSRYV